ncbi:MAG: hypothetical protein AAF391_08455 [Bacteroidota bacterium]
MMEKQILIIEDDEHKYNDIIAQIIELKDVIQIRYALKTSARDAYLQVAQNLDYDLIVLDMALPTFTSEKAKTGASGSAQSTGGLDIIRKLSQLGNQSEILVLSQYPDIMIEGEDVQLEDAAKRLTTKYNVNVVDSILYRPNENKWKEKIKQLVVENENLNNR